MSCDNRPVEFERVIVARTLTTWLAADESVAVQMANPSSESLALHAGLEIGKLSSVAVVSPAQLHVHAVAATSNTATEIAAARAENIAPLSRAFVDSTFTGKQQSAILDSCAKYRPVDRPPYRPNPHTSEVIDKCVNKRLKWGIIEERPSPWGSPCTIVDISNGSPVSVLITAIPSTATSSARAGLCPTSSPAWMPSETPSTFQWPTFSARSGSYPWPRGTSTAPPS